MTIRSERHVYVGAHLTQNVKEAVRVEAAKRGMSMSQWIYLAIVEKLAATKKKIA